MKNLKLFNFVVFSLLLAFTISVSCTGGFNKKGQVANYKYILEVSESNILLELSSHNNSPAFLLALDEAESQKSNNDFLTLFSEAYQRIAPNEPLSTIFNTIELRHKISFSSSNQEVLEVIKKERDVFYENTISILTNRIKGYGIRKFKVYRLDDNSQIVVEIPEDFASDRLKEYIIQRGNLEFWETYENAEVFPFLVEINDQVKEIIARKNPEFSNITERYNAKITDLETDGQDNNFASEHPFFSILSPNIDPQGQLYTGAVVGYVNIKDTSLISQTLSLGLVRNKLPRDLKLLWSTKPVRWDVNNEIFELISIKITNHEGTAPVDGRFITNAKTQISKFTGEHEILLTKNEEGAFIWARLTRDNIGRSIAIVIDGEVFSSPRVNQEITGGRSSISGNFTSDQAMDLANILKFGRLPVILKIIDEGFLED